VNEYYYVRNAAISLTDPLGLAPQFCGIDHSGRPIYCEQPDPAWGHGPDDTCGPDITRQFLDVLVDVTETFARQKFAMKCAMCKSLYAGNPLRALKAWDILDLFVNGSPDINARSQQPGFAFPFVGTGNLRHTVTIEGKCYHAGAANYALFGRANALCRAYYIKDYSLEKALTRVGKYKRLWGGTLSGESLAFTRFGYDGTSFVGVSLGESLNPKKLPSYLSKFTWIWLPYNDRW
jgi:hypothetical protein